MSPPDFDFQLGKLTRLRGHGPRGLAALLLVLLTFLVAAGLGYPRINDVLRSAILHLTSAPKNTANSGATPDVQNF